MPTPETDADHLREYRERKGLVNDDGSIRCEYCDGDGEGDNGPCPDCGGDGIAEPAPMVERATLTALQTWAWQAIGATIDNPANAWSMPRQEGPTVVPFVDLFGGTDSTPHHPASYGRYLVIDLDENNAASIAQWLKRNPGRVHVPFGWGVCRAGFGLQSAPPLTEAEAVEWAATLNAQHADQAAAILAQIAERNATPSPRDRPVPA